MGSSAQVTFAFLAKDAASSTIRGLSRTLGGLQSVASRVGSVLQKTFKAAVIGVGAAIGAATAAAYKFTKAAIEDEAAQARLNAVLKARGLATTENLAATEEAIKAGARLAFTDDEIRGALAAATQFTNDFAKAQRISAVAQDLARAKGIPLEKATVLVGRAFAGSTGALSRYGVTLEKGTKGTAALQAISGKFAGSAAAYAQTTAGSLESISIQLQEAGESIGGALLPILNDLLRVFVDRGLPIILSVVDGIKAFIATNRELITSVVETAVGFVSNLIPVLVSVGQFIFGTIIPAIVGFVQQLTAPGGLVESVGKVVGPLVDNLIPVFQSVVENVVKLGTKIFELVGILWGDGEGPLAAAIKGVVGVGTILFNIFGNIVGAIGDAIGAVINLGKAIMDSPIGWIIKQIAGLIGGAAGAVGSAFNLGGGGVTPAAVTSGGGRDAVGGNYAVSNTITFGRDATSSIATTIGADSRVTNGTRTGGRF